MSDFKVLLFIAMGALIVAFFITMIRFLYGPSLIDRIVTFDLMTANLIGVIGIYAMVSDAPILIDVALVLALLGFFTITAFSYYIRFRRRND